ncbi:MAG: alkylhydroperoxidase-related (seleno)protein, partial [Alphaproteobacteria bacterium]|nr:alkylhydroperoxidase-related (seleno)protein [Alphaproteobacteria bacterium]
GNDYDLRAVTGEAGGIADVNHGELMNAFTEAICTRDLAAMAAARQGITSAMGERGMVDAAAVIAAFNAYPRIADATGIPLEDAKAEATEGMRAELDLDRLDTGPDE